MGLNSYENPGVPQWLLHRGLRHTDIMGVNDNEINGKNPGDAQ